MGCNCRRRTQTQHTSSQWGEKSGIAAGDLEAGRLFACIEDFMVAVAHHRSAAVWVHEEGIRTGWTDYLFSQAFTG